MIHSRHRLALATAAALCLATLAPPGRAAPQVGPELTLGGSAATRPSAAHNGRWGLVTWANADKVQAQVVDAAGQPVGEPFLACNTRSCSGAQLDPVVAEPLKDTFLIVWQDDRNASSAHDLYGARIYVNPTTGAATNLDSAGLLLSASDRLPIPSDDGPAYQIASDRQGIWLLVYNGDDIGLGTRVTADGAVLDQPPVPLTGPGRFDAFLHAAYGRDGKFLVTWVDRAFDTEGGDIFGHIVTASSFAAPTLGAALQLSQSDGARGVPRDGGQEIPASSFVTDRFLVAWQDTHHAFDTVGLDLFGRLIGLDGRTVATADVIALARDPGGSDGVRSTTRQSAPSVVGDGAAWLVTYLDGAPFDNARAALRVRHVGVDGQLRECAGPFDAGFTVAGTGTAADPGLTSPDPASVISVRRGQWIVYYLRDARIRARTVSFAPHAPVANAGANVAVSWCTGAANLPKVKLSGGATDIDRCDTLGYRWTDVRGKTIATTQSPEVLLPIGTHDLKLTATDGALESSDSVTVTITGVACEPLVVSGAVTCDAGGGRGRLNYDIHGGLGPYTRSGTLEGRPLAHGSAWSVVVTDQSGHRATAAGTISCPFSCPPASACDGSLAVDVQVACNPLSLQHPLEVSVTGGSGSYQLCGDAAGGATVASGEAWRVLATDRVTGACGLAEGVAACAPVAPACPTVSLSGARLDTAVCEGDRVSSALIVSPGTGAYSIRWLAGEAPIPGATSASLDWTAASPDGCGEDDVALTAEVTCAATSQVGVFDAGHAQIQAAPRAPSSDVQTCTTQFVPACAGDALVPLEYTAADGEQPGTTSVQVTPGGASCPVARFDVPTAGCTDCALDAGQLVTSSPTDFCAASGQGRIVDATSQSGAPSLQYLVSDASGLVVRAPNKTGHFDLTDLPIGTYHLFAVASTQGVTGTSLPTLTAAQGCYSLSPPLVVTVASCACPLGCDDFDACTEDRCDDVTRRCVFSPRACDDGDACTGTETCDPARGCLAGPALTCDDQDVCNGAESCDPRSGCRAGAPLLCDDDQACNGLETCQADAGCVTTGALACDDGDPCNGVETCDGNGGCLPGTPPSCDDRDACNGLEQCRPGVGCVSGQPVVCDDHDACNGAETCNPASGVCGPGAAPACDDGDPCNGAESCDAARGCVTGQPIACDDGNPCNGAETCDPTGGCRPAAAPFDCDDDNPCNGAETCDPARGCVAGTPRDCSDQDACTDDVCDPTSGACQHPALDCADDDLCDGAETCAPGVGCVPGTPAACGDGNLCNGAESCLPSAGCLPPAPVDCDDQNACTTDACAPPTGCSHAWDAAACPDAKTVDLGPRLGTLVAHTDLGAGCWSGTVGATPCLDLPFCTLTAIACWDENDQLASVALEADGDLGPFGEAHFSGGWSASGWCLTATPADASAAGLPLTDVVATVCVDPDASTTLAGDIQFAGYSRSFSGTFESDTDRFSATFDDFLLGALPLENATLTFSGAPLTAGFTGTLQAGRGPRATTLDVAGDVGPGDFTLSLSLPESATWTPLGGATITAVQGELAWVAENASAWLSLGDALTLAPLGTFAAPAAPAPSAARATLSADGARVSGCIALPAPADTILAGLPLSELSTALCFGADPSGDLVATVDLAGAIGLGDPTPAAFTGALLPGPTWQLTARVDEAPAGGFTLDQVTVLIAGNPSTSSATLSGLVTVPVAADPLVLAVSGPWTNHGPASLAASQPPTDDWLPRTGVNITSFSGTFARAANGTWSASLSAAATLGLGPFGTRAGTGPLTVSPDDVRGCLLTQPFNQTLAGLDLRALVVSACLGKDASQALATTWPVAGKVRSGGVDSTLTEGVYRPDAGLSWELDLAWPGLDLGAADFTSPRVRVRSSAQGALTTTLVADLIVGTGDTRLVLEVEGAFGTGDLTLAATLSPGATWQPLPGVVIAQATGQVKRLSGVWSGTLTVASHVALGPLGSAAVTGTLTLEADFAHLSGCLPGTLADRTLGGFTLTQGHVDLCFTDDAPLSVEVATDLTVAGQTVAATGSYTPHPDAVAPAPAWTLDLALASLHLGPFHLESPGFLLQGSPAWPASTVSASLAARLTIANVNRPLTLSVAGPWQHLGDLSLALTLPVGTSWSPVPGESWSALGGALARTRTGWSAEVTANAPFDFGPFGARTLSGAFTVSADARTLSGCLSSASRYQGVVAGLAFSDTAFEACLAPDPQAGLLLTLPLEGRVALETGAAPVPFDGRFLPGATLLGAARAWRVELDVPDLDLGPAPLDLARLVIEQPLSLPAPTLALELALTIGDGPTALVLQGGGRWAASGDLDLPLALPPGTVWEPATDLIFGALDAHYRRAAGVWTLEVGVDTTVNLGPFGLQTVTGSFTLSPDGTSLTGCLLGDAPDATTLAGFELRQLSARLCLEDSAFGVHVVPGLAGELSLPADPIWYPVAITFSPGADWAVEMTVTDLALGPYTLDTATFRVTHFGPPLNEDALSLEAEKLLGAALPGAPSAAIALVFSGGWSHSDEVVVGIDTEPAATWEPASDLTFSDIGGQLTRIDGAWRLELEVTTALALDPFGMTTLTGTLLVDDAGETLEGCLSAIAPAATPLSVNAVTFAEARPGACWGGPDGTDPDLRTFPLSALVGATSDLGLGLHHPPGSDDVPAGLAWQFALEVPPFTLGTWEARGEETPLAVPYFDGESWYFGEPDDRASGLGPRLLGQRTTTGALGLLLSTRITAHDGVGESDLVLDLEGPWAGDTRALSLSATQVADTGWAPSPLAPDLVLRSVTGDVNRTSELWGFAVTGTAELDLAPFGPLTLQGNVTWNVLAGLSGTATGPVSLGTLAGFPIRNAALTARFTTAPRFVIDLPPIFGSPRPTPPTDTLVYTLAGEISWGAGYLPFTATYDRTPDGSWSLALTVHNLVLGAFTLPDATLTMTPDPAGGEMLAVSGKLVTSLYDLIVAGTWSHGADMIWTANGKVIAQGGVAPVGAQVGGAFSRTAGTWKLDMSALTPLDLGPFGTINLDSATKAEAQAAAGGVACDTFARPAVTTLTALPTVGGIPFSNVVVEACYDHAAAAWTYELSAMVSVNGELRPLTGALTLPQPNTIQLVGALDQLSLGGGFFATQSTLTFDWTKNVRDEAKVQGRIVLFGNPGSPAALHLDINDTWPKTGPLTLDLAMPEDLPWRPNADLTATAISGRITRSGSEASIQLSSTFQAYLGPQLGAHDISGTFTIQTGGIFTACLETASGAAFNLQLGGVSLKQIRLKACMARTLAGAPPEVSVGLRGRVDMRGTDFDFSATFQTLATGGWKLTASVANLTLGGFQLANAMLEFSNGGRLLEVKLIADIVLGSLSLRIDGQWRAAGDFSVGLGMTPGTSWEVAPSFVITGASGHFQVYGTTWTVSISVGTEISFGPVHDVAVTGNLTMVKRNNGNWEAEGCIAGALAASETAAVNPGGENRGLAGAITATACFGAETRLSLKVANWTPIPSVAFTVPNVELVYQTVAATQSTPAGWILTAEAGPPATWSWDINDELSIKNLLFKGTLTDTGAWSVGVQGTSTFGVVAGQPERTLTLSGSYESATSKLTVAAKWVGTIALGGSGFNIVDPTVTLSTTLNTGSPNVQLRLTAPFELTVRGTKLTGSISGGGAFGDTASFWFAGSLATPQGGLTIPGFQPINGSLCVAIASGPVAEQEICPATETTPAVRSALAQGVRLMVNTQLPAKLAANQGSVLLSIILETGGKLTLSATLDVDWYIMAPGQGFAGIDWMKVDRLTFYATIDGANIAMGFEGLVEFMPSDQPTGTPSLAGVINISFNLTDQTLSVLMYIDGRWYDPFGLDGLAIENPGLAISIKISSFPPVPTSVGANLDFYWKRTGSWPAFLPTPDTCATQPPCADGCLGHLKCQIQRQRLDITHIGGTAFIDVNPSPSGFCILGACLPLPTYIFRLDIGNLALSDVVNLLMMPLNILLQRLQQSLAGILPPSLANLAFPTMPSGAGLDIHTLFIAASTHNKSVFGLPFSAGFRALIDIEVAETSVFFDGYLGMKGVSANGYIEPFTLLGQQFEGDPFARYAAPGASGWVQVAHESKLDFFDGGGTVEGWLRKDSALSVTATFANKLSPTAGWAIEIGQPEECSDGSCPPRSRVVITARSGGQTRTVRTREGAITPSERTHLAVLWHQSTKQFEVRVNGAALDLEEMNQPALTSVPADNASPLKLGQGLALLDDVRLWNVTLSADDIAGRARILDPGFPKWSELVARWEFDFDKNAVAYNSRWYAGTDGQTTSKLHGAHLNGSTSVDDPEDRELFARLSLRLDRPNDTGFFAAVGTNVRIPILVPNGMSARGRVRLGGGQMFAEAYVRDFEMLKLGDLGAFVIGGYGQNLEVGDFDDGVYARLQLQPEFALDIGATLGWGAVGNANLIGSATVGADSSHVFASGTLNLTMQIPLLGATGLTGSFTFDTNTGMRINGSVVVAGRSLTSGSIYVDRDKLEVTASIDLGTVFGFDLGGPSIKFTLDWANRDLCGTFGWGSPDGVSCSIGVCLGLSGLDFDFDCGGIEPCDGDGDCAASEFCMLGAWCKDDYGNGWGPCNRSAMCQSGACGALFGSQCYQPHTKGQGDLCFAEDQCVVGLVCRDIAGVGRCRPTLGYNDWGCESSADCQTGLVCLDVGASHRCLNSGLGGGESCQRDAECLSGSCKRDVCECSSDSHCRQGYFCHEGECLDRGRCSSSSQCNSGESCVQGINGGYICSATNWSPQGGPCVAQTDCQVTAAAASPMCLPMGGIPGMGKCGCAADSNCGSGYRCDASSLTCVPKLGTYSICTRDADCATGLCALLSWKIMDHFNFVQAAGPPPSPHKYWPNHASCSPRATVALGGGCYTNEECAPGLCSTNSPHVCTCNPWDPCSSPLGKLCQGGGFVNRPTSTPYTGPFGAGCSSDCECDNASKCVAPRPSSGSSYGPSSIDPFDPGHCMPLESGEVNACNSCQSCSGPTCARPGTPTQPRLTLCARDTECPATWSCVSAYSIFGSGSGNFDVCLPQTCQFAYVPNQCPSGLECKPSNGLPTGKYCLP